MRKQIARVILAATAAILAFGDQNPSPTGAINGRVVNESGLPVRDAKVSVDSTEPGISQSLVRYVETDGSGFFKMDRLKFGTYRVYAMKESEGYANPYFSLYGNGLKFEASLSAERPAADILVIIGPKAATISGSISDAKTGQPMGANIRIWRLDHESDFIAVSVPANYELLVPPGADIGVEVSAPGYETWRYPADAQFSAKSLRIESGGKRHIDVGIQPKL